MSKINTMSNTPFKLRSGNKPPFKKMGSSPLQDDKGDGNHPMHHEGAGGTLKELEELYEHRGYRTKKEEMEMELPPDATEKTTKADPTEEKTQDIKKDKQGRPIDPEKRELLGLNPLPFKELGSSPAKDKNPHTGLNPPHTEENHPKGRLTKSKTVRELVSNLPEDKRKKLVEKGLIKSET